MPSKLKEIKINSLKEFTEFIEDELPKSDMFWFRGCGKSSYKLIPSLYRHPKYKTIEELLDLEIQIISRFKQRSTPYLTRSLLDNWEYLFYMQHFGVPTRLLDWTENPYIALYFALTRAHFDDVSLSYINDAAIWVLKPASWNRAVLEHIDFKGNILTVSDNQLNGYAPATDIDLMNKDPVAIYGTHNSPRIVAQKGVFIIFGKNLNAMEDIYENINLKSKNLIKLIFPLDKINSLLDSVLSIGFTDSVVFPDLEGLSKEIKRFFKFKVNYV